jgi:signal transduction histidine kinase
MNNANDAPPPTMAREADRRLAQLIDGSAIATIVIDEAHVITHWNRALTAIAGLSGAEMVGTRDQWRVFYESERPIMADLVLDGAVAGDLTRYYGDKGMRQSPLAPDAFEAEDFFPALGDGGRWLFFTAVPLRDADGKVIGAMETLQDITARKLAELALAESREQLEALVEQRTRELQQRASELEAANHELEQAQSQLVQSEKMASVGQLAAGVAHEINNPVGFVNSNLNTLGGYIGNLLQLIDAYEQAEGLIAADPASHERVSRIKREVDLDFLRGDLPSLLKESGDGLDRVKKIVQNLKNFSHAGEGDWQMANLQDGLESTLSIVHNEIKYKAEVLREYAPLPPVECLPQELNQVFMNMLVNASHAIENKGLITVRTGTQDGQVWVEFEDNGKGIAPEHLSRIFDPFFTTKPVGKGTGLGLSLSYSIVQKHKGRIEVSSEIGRGSRFRIWIPASRQP